MGALDRPALFATNDGCSGTARADVWRSSDDRVRLNRFHGYYLDKDGRNPRGGVIER